jgi:ribosome modulation factor
LSTPNRTLAEIYASGVADIDDVFGRFDEEAALLSMTKGREQAWRVAVVLTDVGVPPIAAGARWLLRTTAAGGATFILGGLDPSVAELLRGIEAECIEFDTVLERPATDRRSRVTHTQGLNAGVAGRSREPTGDSHRDTPLRSKRPNVFECRDAASSALLPDGECRRDRSGFDGLGH